ncbi:thiopeptide-type bacteriocin biosynthesis protein [Hamadaea tsunoensis]|uniref:thiopeptide-type bacteriocin biosynthesis protein n=1 Tax=Hamadaea tsunoensis TaxID=53368 RepID=UPI00041E1ADB|nr:thiopeptide-type bacteriocin biosynthesis protein [Hamadaea tsunoensis]
MSVLTADPPVTARGQWLALHCFAYWRSPDLDDFLARTVAPLLDRLRAEDRIADWFYIRYWEGGPHLRIRVRDADPATGAWLREELARQMAEAGYPVGQLSADTYYQRLGGPAAVSGAGWHAHGEVAEIAYKPEIHRYGGERALPVAEEVFCRSTDIAVRVVAATTSEKTRLAAITELTIATALALGLDRLATARWLREHAGGWRWNSEVAMVPPSVMQERSAKVLALQSGTLQQRWARTEALIEADPEGLRSPVARWAAVIRQARERLEAEPAPDGLWHAVWSSQLHMLFNRLGITPDEERSVCWLVAGTALTPQGIPHFFEDGAQAPDRRYHEAAKYLPGDPIDQAPREEDGPGSATRVRRRLTGINLPSHELPPVSLAEAMRLRGSARGRITGPVSDVDLGTLLWSAHAVTHTQVMANFEYPHRPYPSAGAKYVARVRLVVRDVAGLEPGCYHVDPVGRRLAYLGAAPTVADLRAMSMWFQDRTGLVEGLDIGAAPAMLAVYVELGRLRPRYGMRALRFAVAEAGHLAQNLALVAAATGLHLGMIGGFYDDLVHEVFGLDGIDNLAIYLMPVGGSAGAGQQDADDQPAAEKPPKEEG